MVTTVRNIFLAEDDEDDVYFFAYAVKSLAPLCSLIVANNGLELLQKLQNTASLPDIIFIDINMPLMDGFETLGLIKKDPALSAVPVIMYSTSSQDTEILKAYNNGASSYLVKPFELSSLEQLIAKVFDRDWKAVRAPNRLSKFVILHERI